MNNKTYNKPDLFILGYKEFDNENYYAPKTILMLNPTGCYRTNRIPWNLHGNLYCRIDNKFYEIEDLDFFKDFDTNGKFTFLDSEYNVLKLVKNKRTIIGMKFKIMGKTVYNDHAVRVKIKLLDEITVSVDSDINYK